MAIQLFENFLIEPLYEEVYNATGQILKSGGNQLTTNRHWDRGIFKDSAPVLVHNVNKESQLHKNLKKTIETKTNLVVRGDNIMIYFWTRYSYIPWHSDPGYAGALTIYLNKKWHPDYGGYFLYCENKEDVQGVTDYEYIKNIRAIQPKRNLGILQTDKMNHCTTPVNFDGDMRLTVQAFLDKPE